MAQPLGSPDWVLYECFLSTLCGSSFVIESWFLLAHSCVGLTLRLANSEAQPTQHASCWSHETKFASAGFGFGLDFPVDMLLVNLIGSCYIVWSWALLVFVLGLFGATPLQSYIRHCLCLALGNLFGVICNVQLVDPSAGPGCMWKGPSCTPWSAFTSTMGRQQKSQAPRSLPDCRFLLGLITEKACTCTQPLSHTGQGALFSVSPDLWPFISSSFSWPWNVQAFCTMSLYLVCLFSWLDWDYGFWGRIQWWNALITQLGYKTSTCITGDINLDHLVENKVVTLTLITWLSARFSNGSIIKQGWW